jgi:hypothetical protein
MLNMDKKFELETFSIAVAHLHAVQTLANSYDGEIPPLVQKIVSDARKVVKNCFISK